MSLLDGRHTVTVQNRVPVATAYGASYVDVGTPVLVACDVRVLSTSETTELGIVDSVTIRILARSWPGDARSLISWLGNVFEARGMPIMRDGSPMTAHIEVIAVRVGGHGGEQA